MDLAVEPIILCYVTFKSSELHCHLGQRSSGIEYSIYGITENYNRLRGAGALLKVGQRREEMQTELVLTNKYGVSRILDASVTKGMN